MTICIAAICEGGRALIAAGDREFGIGFTSAEMTEQKFHPLFMQDQRGRWLVALSGTVSHAVEVIGEIRRLETTLQSRQWYDVKGVLETAYRGVRLSKAEGEVLGPRGWALEEFKKHGVERLPPSTYANLDARLGLYDLEADLIVAGFADDGFPCILTVRNPGLATEQTKLGFWCIGSGSTLAQASLFSREYSQSFSLEKAAYCIYEAKRNAERATGVGDKETDILVVTAKKDGLLDGSMKALLESAYTDLRPREFGPELETKFRSTPIFTTIRKYF